MTTLLGSRRPGVGPAELDRLHPEDAAVFPPPTLPLSLPSKADAVWRVGKYIFRADFDSANLDSVEQGVAPNEFFLQTRRDCGGTENEKATRTWFHFSVAGGSPGDLMVLTILNLNKQSRLYSQDYRPVFRCASQSEWQPLRLRVTYRREGEDFQLRFCHRFESDEETLFAFAIPFSYQETQDMLDHLDDVFPYDIYGTLPASSSGSGGSSSPAAPLPSPADPSCCRSPRAVEPLPAAPGASAPSTPRTSFPGSTATIHSPRDYRGAAAAAGVAAGRQGLLGRCSSSGGTACSSSSPRSGGYHSHGPDSERIYYRRQLLTHSLEGRHVEVITITDCRGASTETEPPLPGVFEHDPGPPAAAFRDKTVFFVSSRVHPGETPATHMFNGMLAFLLRRSDPRAAALRRRFVFKLVPLVNPDGVAVGNYRTDTLGQNLNRFYNGIPDEATQPSVFAIKSLLMHYAGQGVLEYYMDLHAHANKKGVFIYGNTLADGEAHLQSLLYARLVGLNNKDFDFVGCNYTEKNMVRPDKDGASKEGAGRVALYRETGLTHLYTVEANYNTSRTLNVVAPAAGDHGGRASPPCNKRFPPKFTVNAFHAVGRAILIAALDLEGSNPWSRLPHSEHRSLEGVRSWLITVLRATAETRAAHLPPISDAALEALRGMIASGALRVSAAALASLGSRQQRQRSSSRHVYEGTQSSAAGYGTFGTGAAVASAYVSVAFGRSVSSAPAPITRRAPLPPTPSSGRRTLPVISNGGALHGAASMPLSGPPSIAPRGSDGRGSLGGGGGSSGGGLGRSASLPMRNSTPPANLLSPRGTLGRPKSEDREPGSETASAASGPGLEEAEGVDVPEASGVGVDNPARGSAEEPSDSDGDDTAEEATVRVATPATQASSVQVPLRFRAPEPPVRSTPAYTFKGAAVYCGRVTEFKFPLSDRILGSHDGSQLTTAGVPDGAMRGSLTVSGPGFGPAVRSRPPSAGSGGARPPSASGSGSGSSSTGAPGATVAVGAGGAVPRRAGTGRKASWNGSSAGAPGNGAALGPHHNHLVLPRTLGNGAAVLMTPEQLAAGGGGGPVATPRSRSTLSFGRSGSANRRNR